MIAVVNLIGRKDMGVLSDNPFTCIDDIINTINVDIIILDFHAEATAEKIAMGYYVDGRITAMFGTHTHVQTADEKILEKGTGYITDIGMTGPEKSVIGMNIEEATFVIDKFLDDSSLAKLNTVRIVHGKGTGKLRDGIHKFLKKNPHVKSFRMGTFGEGEMGVTVVELK